MAITASISLVENSYDVAKNTSSVTCKVTAHWTYGSYDHNKTKKTLTFNGTTYSTTTNINANSTTSGSQVLFNKTVTVTHNSDGSKTVSASTKIPTKTSSGTVTASKSLTLTKIPRYPSITQAYSSATETTITMNWSSGSVCDYLWYSINGGSSWVSVGSINASSGSYTITGLTAGQEVQIVTSVRAKDSQLSANSTVLNTSTYWYPYCTIAPDFKIGEKLNLQFYNPLGRTFTFYIIANGTQIANSWTISGKSYSGIDADSSQNQLYATIPNAKSAKYQVKTVWGSYTWVHQGGTYSADANVCSPEIDTCYYEDVNSATVAITENNQNIIQNRSVVRYTARDLTVKKSATISSVKVAVNGNTYDLTVSNSVAVGGNAVINSGQDVTATFTLTDSRGFTASKDVTVKMLALNNPSAIITVQRANNFYSETSINCDAEYSDIGGKNTITITYKARVQGTDPYTVTGSLQDNVPSTVTLDNQYSWELVVTLTDYFGMTTSYTAIVSRGMPIIYFDRINESVGINCFPKHQNTLEIDGDIYINSALLQDFVVEQGSSGIWIYRKWNSGIAECWGYVTGERISMTTHYGALYYGALITQAFPSGLFVSAPPMVQVQAYDNGNGTYASIQTWTKDNVTYYPYTTASATYITGFIFNAKGRWK